MKVLLATAALVTALAAVTVASAQAPGSSRFNVALTVYEEVPACTTAQAGAGGFATFRVIGPGAVEYRLYAFNLPGRITAAHIHIAPAGEAGPILQPLELNGNQWGLVGSGTFTNPSLVAAMRARPDLYYVNVHTTSCPGGAERGQINNRLPIPVFF